MGKYLDTPMLDALRMEEESVETYRTSQTGMGTAMLNEMVKSYGLRRRDDGAWEWSLDNIGKAFRDDPFWTTLDYATMMFAPAKFGVAAFGVARGAKSAGVAGKAYKALKTGVGTADQLAAATTALGGKSATTKWGKRFQALGLDPELAAATEMKLGSGISQFHAFQLPGSERFFSLASPTTVNLSDDYLNLIGRFDGEVFEKRAILRVQEREKLLEMGKFGRDAEIVAREISSSGLDKAGQEKFHRLLGERIRPRDLDAKLAQEFAGNAAAQKAFKNTWGYRNSIHLEAYKLGLISRETYRENLYRYNPRIYEEMVQAKEDLKTLGAATESLPGKFPGAQHTNPNVGPKKSGRTRMVADERSSFQSRQDVAPAYLTEILDPATSLTRLAQAGQEIAKQRFAQGIAKSVLSASPTDIVNKMMQVAQSNDPRQMLLYGLNSEKLEAFNRLIRNVNITGRQAAGEEIFKLLGWKKIDQLYHGRDMPAYLKNLPQDIKDRWVDGSVADELTGGLKMLGQDKDFYAQFYKRLVSTFRASKTAYNPGTHVRNFIGGGIFASIASGDMRSFVPRLGIRAFNERGDILKAAAEAGIVGTSFDLQIHADIAKNANLAARTAIDWLPDNVVTKYVKMGANGLERFYRNTDEYYKLDAWIRSTQKYRKKGMTLEQARNAATIDVNKFMPNFLQQSGLTDTLSKGVPFASFTAQSLRVWKNVLAEKPHMAFFYNHVASTMSDVFGAMAGYAPHEIEEAKNSLPSYMQGKKTLLMPFNVDGKPRFLDLSYLIPMGSISEMESTERLFFNTIVDPTTNPVVNIAAAAATGKDPFSGRDIAPNFTERQLGVAVPGQQMRHVIGLGEHMLQTLLPPLAPPGYAGVNIMEALRGQVNPATGEKLEDGVFRTVLANMGGLRFYAPDVETQIRNVKDAQRKISEEVKQSWDRWEFARANGNLGDMETERQRIIAIKTREGHDDPEGYFLGSEKKRSNAFSELSTKQLQQILKKAEKLGKLSPRDERVRAELMARYQSRKD